MVADESDSRGDEVHLATFSDKERARLKLDDDDDVVFN